MRRLLLAAVVPMLAGAACDACRAAGSGVRQDGGRFLAQRVARHKTTLVSGPARASYCSQDSLLVVVAVARSWTGGLALRAVLPLTAPREFQVRPALDGAGTATVAFRPLDAGVALLGVGGTVRLEPSAAVSGSFDVSLPDSGSARVSIRGTLSRIPLSVLPKDSCSAPRPA